MACALYCNSDGSLNSGGQFLADAGVVFIVFCAVAGLIRYIAVQVKKTTRR
jgi:hypothetical protein